MKTIPNVSINRLEEILKELKGKHEYVNLTYNEETKHLTVAGVDKPLKEKKETENKSPLSSIDTVWELMQ